LAQQVRDGGSPAADASEASRGASVQPASNLPTLEAIAGALYCYIVEWCLFGKRWSRFSSIVQSRRGSAELESKLQRELQTERDEWSEEDKKDFKKLKINFEKVKKCINGDLTFVETCKKAPNDASLNSNMKLMQRLAAQDPALLPPAGRPTGRRADWGASGA